MAQAGGVPIKAAQSIGMVAVVLPVD